MSSSPPAAMSWVSQIMGYIGFAFTIGTFFIVFWDNLDTVWSAPRQVRHMLSNLKDELFEEKAYLLRAQRRYTAVAELKGGHLACTITGTDGHEQVSAMIDAVEDLCQSFSHLEKPFLKQAHRHRNDMEKGSVGGFFKDHYHDDLDFAARLVWTRSKPKFAAIASTLERHQIRRISREVHDVMGTVHALRHPERYKHDDSISTFSTIEPSMPTTPETPYIPDSPRHR